MNSKHRSENAKRRLRTARRSLPAGLPTMGPAAAPMGISMVVALYLTGCPVGSTLDTSYQEYAPPPDGVATVTSTVTSTATSTATSTTSGGQTCTDAQFDETVEYWCGTSACHGTPSDATADAPLWLFSPNRKMEWLNQHAVTNDSAKGLLCTGEVYIDTTTPENSLLIRAIEQTSPCGLAMPAEGFFVYPEAHDCIVSWVNGVVATQAGVVTNPGVGGNSAL